MTDPIVITQNADGSYTIPAIQLVPAKPASSSTPVTASPPPPAPATLADAVITGTVNGQAVSLTVQPGQRVQLVPGNFQCGCVWYANDGSLLYQNDYAGAGNPTPIDLPTSLTAVVGEQTFQTGNITLCYRQWTRPFWVVQPPVQTFDRNLFPYYGTGSESASFVDAYTKADNSILGPSLHDPHTADTGERVDLGLLQGPDAAYLTNPSADAAAVVRGMADASAPFPFHATDTQTGEMLLASDYPKATMYAKFLGAAGNPFQPFTTACQYNLSEATAHAPAFNALAAAMYGTEFDKASLSQWANYVARLWTIGDYALNSGNGPISIRHNQTRGNGWMTRTLAQAAKLSDRPELFASWAALSAAEMKATWPAQTGMPMDQACVVYPHNSFAFFQIDYLVSSIGYAIQLDVSAADYQVALDYFAPLITARMLDAPHEFACIYNAAYKDANGNVAPDWPTALKFTAVNQPTIAAALLCAEDSVEMQSALYGLPAGQMPAGIQQGDFTGGPTSPSGTGYSAIYRGGLVYVAKFATDQTRAQAALTKFLKYDRESYAQDPKYNIVPRAA